MFPLCRSITSRTNVQSVDIWAPFGGHSCFGQWWAIVLGGLSGLGSACRLKRAKTVRDAAVFLLLLALVASLRGCSLFGHVSRKPQTTKRVFGVKLLKQLPNLIPQGLDKRGVSVTSGLLSSLLRRVLFVLRRGLVVRCLRFVRVASIHHELLLDICVRTIREHPANAREDAVTSGNGRFVNRIRADTVEGMGQRVNGRLVFGLSAITVKNQPNEPMAAGTAVLLQVGAVRGDTLGGRSHGGRCVCEGHDFPFLLVVCGYKAGCKGARNRPLSGSARGQIVRYRQQAR